ncbi:MULTISPECIES: DMT family transporter [Paenibacillus]|uniref:DMT family transporter n=1 Tax=Paenibacillus TaxID=44249 RepID=UPI001B1511BA|nr:MULTISPECIES: DMT family transporter [Paenibacillus]UYO03335.1 DMT family transporter [Paenibacillus sp. PSB04]GIO60815.1 multidrug transporter [Paenibacillus cineris]
MKPFKANVMIMIVTLFWGSSYLFMKMGLDSVQPFNLIALRFGLAFIAAGGLFAGRLRRNTDVSVLKHAALLGFILFGVFASIMLGLQGTSTSNAGFLMSLTVIFVPVLSAVFGKSMPSKRLVLGVLLAMTGIGLLTLRPQSGIGFGDLWCILGALLFAVHMMLTGRAAKTSPDPLCIGIWQLGFAGAFGLVFTVLWETPRLPGSISGWVAVLALSLVCSALGFILQTMAQQYTTATQAGLIFALEPVVAAVFGLLFMNETLSVQGYAGAGLVLLGVALSELNVSRLLGRKKQPPREAAG